MPDLSSNPLREGLQVERTPEANTVVIFGASGDLTKRKLVPALYNLGLDRLLPGNFAVIGFARRPIPHDEFRAQMLEGINAFWKSLLSSSEASRLMRMARVYGWDERPHFRNGTDQWEQMRTVFGSVKSMWPEIRTQTSAPIYNPTANPAWVTDPAGQLQYYNVDNINVEYRSCSIEDSDRVRQAGREYWGYHDRTSLRLLPIDFRTLGWSIFHLQLDGFVHFATNNWFMGTDRLDPAQGPFFQLTSSGGDSYNFSMELIFPGPVNTPIGTTRFSNIRDGLEDALYLHMLQGATNLASVRAISEVVAGADGKTLTLNPETLRAQRAEVLRLLNRRR